MEATIFTDWIYDHSSPCAAGKVAHPLMLRAIAVAKRKRNDRIACPKDCRLPALRISCRSVSGLEEFANEEPPCAIGHLLVRPGGTDEEQLRCC